MEAQPVQQQPTAHGKRSGAARWKRRKERQARLDAQFANLEIDPDKPPRLPEEIMDYIVDLVYEINFSTLLNDAKAQACSSFLCTTSLVCSQWIARSRRYLLRHIMLRSDRALRSFYLFCRGEWPAIGFLGLAATETRLSTEDWSEVFLRSAEGFSTSF
jgi:hypothetical protein